MTYYTTLRLQQQLHFITLHYTYTPLHCTALRCAGLHYNNYCYKYKYHYHSHSEYNWNYKYTTLQLHNNYNSNSNYATLHYFTTTPTTTLHHTITTLHYIQQVCIQWPLQPLQKARFQPPFGPSARSLCHPCIATTHLSYRFPIFETSATALCGSLQFHVEFTHHQVWWSLSEWESLRGKPHLCNRWPSRVPSRNKKMAGWK